MKVLLLADPASVHTLRWANALSERGIEIYLFGLSEYDGSLYNRNIKIETINASLKIKAMTDGSLLKVVYLKAISRIKELVESYKPDILHSHYASSFGLLGALTNYHPYIISVWGADIYNFPARSFFHKSIIKYSLSKADKILSTSHVMAERTSIYTKKEIAITPFGIDTERFTPMERNLRSESEIVIGTVKTLEKKYGVEYLIRAFKLVKETYQKTPLKLLIVGSGSLEPQLKNLVSELEIEKNVEFTGFIKADKIPHYHNMIDIFVAASIEDSESFGVAVLEASACGKPVIVSDAGGLPEVVEGGVTGLIAERSNSAALANAIMKLLSDAELRENMGKNGRQKILNEYTWKDSVNKMISIYETCLKSS